MLTDYHSLNVYDATGCRFLIVTGEDTVVDASTGDTLSVESYEENDNGCFITLAGEDDTLEVAPLVIAGKTK